MSQSHGKSKPNSARAAADDEPPQVSAQSKAAAPSSPLSWLLAAGAGAATVVYLLFFLGQDLLPQADRSFPRFLLFTNLLTPDDVAKEWVEGNWRNFMVVDRWKIVLCTAGLLCYLAYTFGMVLVQSRFDWSRLEVALFSQGVGLQFLSLMILSWGLFFGFQVKYILVAFGPLIIVFLACHVRLNRHAGTKDAAILGENKFEPHISRLGSAYSWALRIVLSLLTLAIVLGAMLPPWDFDVREYHLQVPKEWFLQGGVTFLPHNVYGNMPLGAEMHSLLMTAQFVRDSPTSWRVIWWSGLTGKTIMACYGPLTALALYAAGRRFFSPLAGLAAAAVYLSCPWVVHVCVNGLNESAFGFYLFTAVYAALPFRDGRRAAGLSGFLAGAAASCKYPALLFVVLPLAIYLLIADLDWKDANWKEQSRRIVQQLAWRRLAVFLACMLVSCGLWYAKNWVLTGNPVYPLMSSVFGGTTRTPEKSAQWNQAHRPPPYTLGNLAGSAAEIGWKDPFQSPLMIPLTTLGIAVLAVGAIQNRKSPSSSTLHSPLCTLHSLHVLTVTTLLLLFFLAAWWLCTHRLVRFLVPAIPLAALLAGAGVEYARRKPLGYVVAGLMVVGLTYNLLMAPSRFVGDNRWFVSLERLRTDEPRDDQQVSRVKAAHLWLNANVKPGEAVLSVGDAAVFDLEMPVFYNTCFDDCLLVNWTEGKTPEQRREELRSRQVAYVYFDEEEFNRYTSQGNYGYDPRFSPKLLDELVVQGVLKLPLPDAPPKIYPVAP
ncbi:MAG: ArnT family glycosyltransferase [Pirellulaceae bacterium]